MSITCRVIDAGARYGLHPTWEPLKGLADFHLFEIDGTEAKYLEDKYAGVPGITVHRTALLDRDGEVQFSARVHRGLTSVKQVDDDVLRRNDYWCDQFEVEETATVDARMVDSLFGGTDIHFLKLDTEGSELEILQGAESALRSSVVGIRSEATFMPVYRDAPMFGDIHAFLVEQGFELVNLDYDGKGNLAGKFSDPARYGKLVSTDAVWVIDNDRLFDAEGDALGHGVVRYALFLSLNNASDLAVDALIRVSEILGEGLWALAGDPIYDLLRRRLLTHLKALSGLPMFNGKAIDEACRSMFGHPFPDLHRFYRDQEG